MLKINKGFETLKYKCVYPFMNFSNYINKIYNSMV